MFSYNFRNNYALLSYMEYPIILIQEIILIMCVIYYKGYVNYKAFLGGILYFVIAASFLFGIFPRELLIFLVVSKKKSRNELGVKKYFFQPLCTPVGASSKVVQLLEIIRSKNAEAVSILTWFISFFTNFSKLNYLIVNTKLIYFIF